TSLFLLDQFTRKTPRKLQCFETSSEVKDGADTFTILGTAVGKAPRVLDDTAITEPRTGLCDPHIEHSAFVMNERELGAVPTVRVHIVEVDSSRTHRRRKLI
ncbi:hypothetical protein ACVTE8_15495, partial [Staphylococcus aureus]